MLWYVLIRSLHKGIPRYSNIETSLFITLIHHFYRSDARSSLLKVMIPRWKWWKVMFKVMMHTSGIYIRSGNRDCLSFDDQSKYSLWLLLTNRIVLIESSKWWEKMLFSKKSMKTIYTVGRATAVALPILIEINTRFHYYC